MLLLVTSAGAFGADLGEALDALSSGDLDRGCESLREVAASRGPEAGWAEQIARTVNGLEPRRCDWVEGAKEIQRDGRAELIVSQGVLAPVWFGAVLPVYAPEDVSPAGVGLLGIAGLGVGIGGTWLATQKLPVSSGQAMVIYTGELLGAYYGSMIEVLASDRFTAKPAHAGLLIGGAAGVGAAVLFPEASAGDVALVRGGALWGTALGGLTAVFAEPETTDGLGYLVAGTTLGLAAASAVTVPVELRRGQVNAINLGGYAGAITGGGVALIVQADDPKLLAGLVGGGAIAGLTVGAILSTRARDGADFDVPALQLSMLPGSDGRPVAGLGVSGLW